MLRGRAWMASAVSSSDAGCAPRQASTTSESASAAARGCARPRAPSARTAAMRSAAVAAARPAPAADGLVARRHVFSSEMRPVVERQCSSGLHMLECQKGPQCGVNTVT